MTTYKLEIANTWPAAGHENWSDVTYNIRASDGSVVGTVDFNDWPGDPDDLHGLPCDKHGDYLFKEDPRVFTEPFFPLKVGTGVADTTPQGVMVTVFDHQDGQSIIGQQCRPASAEEVEAYWKIRVQLEIQADERESYAAECDWSI